MPYRFRCELCGTVTEDADFSGPGHVCEGCGLVYQVSATTESIKLLMDRQIRQARANCNGKAVGAHA